MKGSRPKTDQGDSRRKLAIAHRARALPVKQIDSSISRVPLAFLFQDSNDGIQSVAVVRKSEVSLSRSTADDQVHFCLLSLLCLSSRASNQEGTNQVAVK